MCAHITEKFNKTTTKLKLKSFAITTTESVFEAEITLTGARRRRSLLGTCTWPAHFLCQVGKHCCLPYYFSASNLIFLQLHTYLYFVSDIAVFVLKVDVKLQLTNIHLLAT